MHAATRSAIFRRLKAANPAPTTELLYGSPFELLVAVMLSAHTTDKSVNAATRELFPVANTPAAIVALGVEGVKPYIRHVGLYNTKSKNLVGLAQALIDRHGGAVPGDRAALEALAGVGRKTASIILNMVFGKAEIAVDTHIFRVANRTGLAPGKHAAPGRGRAARQHAARVPQERAPLAAPPWPLRLHGARAEVPDVHHPRPVRVPAQDTRPQGPRSRQTTVGRAAGSACATRTPPVSAAAAGQASYFFFGM